MEQNRGKQDGELPVEDIIASCSTSCCRTTFLVLGYMRSVLRQINFPKVAATCSGASTEVKDLTKGLIRY